MTPEVLRVQSADGAGADLIVHGAGHADLVYWLPALGVSARHYTGFALALAEHGCGIALHEWRGAGSSDRRAARGSDWRYRDLLADIASGIATLRAQHPQSRVWVGGHSLGAQLAILVLARDPQLAGLLVIASGIPYWRSFPWWQRPLLLAIFAWFRLLASTFGYFPGRRTAFAGNEAKSVILDWIESGLHGRYRHAAPSGDLDAELAQLMQPLLAVHLRDDRFVPKSSLAGLLAKLPRAQLQRHDLTPADFESGLANHFSWLKEPLPVARRIAEFIRTRA